MVADGAFVPGAAAGAAAGAVGAAIALAHDISAMTVTIEILESEDVFMVDTPPTRNKYRGIAPISN